ncbi:error-prone DNA polymerase [Ferrimicrobium sp.]|uniref:error-prone DNA polymerase n=1 Tax=Ferrimicrobium sp. TaxID=2926050 RepID=UPI002626DD36|nr:error-prone DNA polymerase [Ferrimicrobium sp.]
MPRHRQRPIWRVQDVDSVRSGYTASDPPVSGYAELHAHSYFSFLDGVVSPEDLVAAASHAGLAGIALTDHNGLYGVPRFLAAAHSVGIQPIIGAEVTLGRAETRTGAFDPPGEHLVVLAASIEGYQALSRTLAEGHLRGGSKGVFSLSLDQLAANQPRDGWIVLTGCRKGPLSRAFMEEGPNATRRRLSELEERFGRDALVIEIHDHGDPLDAVRADFFAALATERALPLVGTQNVHALDGHGQRLATVAAAIRSNSRLAQLDGYLPSAGVPRLRTPKEQRQHFGRYPGVVAQTLEVMERCRFPLQLIAPGLPRSLAPAGATDSSWLRNLTFERAPQRYGVAGAERVPGAYRQLGYELDIIEALGFAGYFLVVTDLVDFCRREGIYCQGRGSAANSAVCYALGITNADPVALGLLFERFLSPERDGPPDIDIDIESGRREEVLQYVFRRYGREHAAQVASLITYRARSVLRDSARVYGVPTTQIDRWSRQIERRGSLRASLEARDHRGHPLLEVPTDIAQIALGLEDAPRHLGLHVGGMVICDRPIIEVCPVEWARKAERSVLQWDKDDCARMGLVKFDLLGLGMLGAIHEMVDLVKEAWGVTVDIALLPQEEQVYEMLQHADSIGLFQVESRAQMATLPRLKPTCFYDLVVEVALIRPGPIQGGSVHPYLRRRSGEEAVTYAHPLLERSLAKTLGVPLFQEQLMQMAMDVAGFSPAQADELRQAMSSRRSTERMERLKRRLFAGMEANGVDDRAKEEIYQKLSAFANFGFPESHAASFAYLVYVSAWFKLHYPAALYAGILRSQPMGFWSPQTLLRDATRHGVEIMPPDVNHGSAITTLEAHDGEIRLRVGLNTIRGIGDEKAHAIIGARPYDAWRALLDRVELNESQLVNLAKAGAFDSFGEHRHTVIWQSGEVVRDRGGLSGIVAMGTQPPFPPLDEKERQRMESHALGFVTDGHPLELLRTSLERSGVVRSDRLGELGDGTKVTVAGIITHRQRPGTAKGVVFLNLEDEAGLVNVLLRPGVWVRFREAALASAVLVTGRLQCNGEVRSVIASKVTPLDGTPVYGARNFQ